MTRPPLNEIFKHKDKKAKDQAIYKAHLQSLDAVLEKRKKKRSSKKPMEEAKKFLQEIKDCKEKKYPSSGQGRDYRFEGKDKVGSALVYRKIIIHMAFFKISKEERVGRMSGYKRRRGYSV